MERMDLHARKVAKKKAAGVDDMRPEEAVKYIQLHYQEIISQLRAGTYHPQRIAIKFIPKKGNGMRKLSIATVQDRVIMACLYDYLENLFGKDISEFAFAYRKGRGPQDEMLLIKEYCRSNQFVVSIDIQNFFDGIGHDRLLFKLRQKIHDKRIFRLINECLKTSYEVDGVVERSYSGIQQGSAMSPILSNLALSDLDQEMKKRGIPYARYADDIIAFSRSEQAAKRTYRNIEGYIRKEYQLAINQEKSQIANISEGFNVLGFHVFKSSDGVHIRPKQEKIQSLRDNVKSIIQTEKADNVNSRLKEVISGWIGYFGIAEISGTTKNLDSLIVREVRKRERKDGIRIDKDGLVNSHEFYKEKGSIASTRALGNLKNNLIPVDRSISYT